ncbi:MAG: DUF1730 domain-containing protein [Evtepia sp.]
MNKIWNAADAVAWGVAEFGDLSPFMSTKALEAVYTLCPNPTCVMVGAFSYFVTDSPGNLSLYCRGEDYHRVVMRRLLGIAETLKKQYPDHRFIPGVDNSPLPERTAARLAGIGICGHNGPIIVPPYGSYVFLGTILSDLTLTQVGKTQASPSCEQCYACVKACPTAALTEQGCDYDRCLSRISQKKGTLSPEEIAWMKQSPTIWGCDLCQRACPHNQAPKSTHIPEFMQGILVNLSRSDLTGLSNRTFREQYGDRAFAWRGLATVRRNLELSDQNCE